MDLNLIQLLDFYFLLVFLASTWRRAGQYLSAARLALSGRSRWPHLLRLVKQHRTIFMTWGTVLPALSALVLSVVQLSASRLVWPEAGRPPDGLTFARLLEHWPAFAVALPLGLGMLAVDIYGLIVVGQINRAEMEKHFDQAEFWLRSSTAHVVRVVTFGFINPRRMVHDEVRKALIQVSAMLNTSLWWLSLSMGLRFGFGLCLWLTWALTR